MNKQIFAKIVAAAPAIEAFHARGGIGRHHSLADAELADVLAGRDDIAGQLVPEQGGRDDHAGVVAAAKHLHVGTAGEGGLHAHQHVAVIDFRYRYRLYLQIFFAIEHGGHHLTIH